MAVFIIAEIGVNHNGSLALARRMIREAANQGADAVKFQSFRVDRLVVRGTEKAAYQARNTGAGESQDAMLRRFALSAAEQGGLKELAEKHGVEFLSSPFDEESLAELLTLGVKRVKIPSGEITNAPLLLSAARTRLPILLSTGMASLGEVEEALGVLAVGLRRARRPLSRATFRDALIDKENRRRLRQSVTLLHCTTQYPTPFEDVNLRAMQTLAASFGMRVGYSDHTSGTSIALAAAALGAVAIEKHFTLDRGMPGPDQQASLEPIEFGAMVRGVREIEAALGDGLKVCSPSERANRDVARKSLVVASPVRCGDRFSADTLTAKRPGTGRSPMDYWDVLGLPAPRAFDADEQL